jgi:hypothetical protein
MERRGRRPRRTRFIRVALVLAATVAGTGLVGFGGLAAWQGYTENAGNTVAAGTVTHSNAVGSATCTSVTSAALLNQVGNVCAAIINVANVDPASPATLATGGVKITSTGTLNSSFTMQMAAAPTGNLCADLVLTVVDASSVTNYPATALSTEMGTISLNDSAGAGNWPGTSPGPAGSDTYTFTVTKGAGFNTNSSDAGQSCSFSILFTQVAA